MAVAVVWFLVFETALRLHGGSEAAPAFQQLFMPDAATGHRLKPGASTRYSTAEFSTTIAINAQGVRDDEPHHFPVAGGGVLARRAFRHAAIRRARSFAAPDFRQDVEEAETLEIA